MTTTAMSIKQVVEVGMVGVRRVATAEKTRTLQRPVLKVHDHAMTARITQSDLLQRTL